MSPSSSAINLNSNVSPPSSSEATHRFITIEPRSPTTSQPNMPPEVSSEELKDQDEKPLRKMFPSLKELWMQHKRTKPLAKAPGVQQSVKAIIKTSWSNVLLVFIPLSWIFHFLNLNNTLVFLFSFLAIVPLSNLLAFATDELSMRLGQTLAGLLNATLGNVVELIVAIVALVKCELSVVQSSLVGSILSNLLLILGVCFFAGGTRFSEQGFGISAAQLDSSLLTLSVIAVLLPAAFHNSVKPTDGTDPLTNAQEGHDILSISRGVSVILLFIYLCYLIFQLFSHKNLYDDQHLDVQPSVEYHPDVAKKLHIRQRINPVPIPPLELDEAMSAGNAHWDVRSLEAGLIEKGEEVPKMGVHTTIALLIVVTVLVAITAEFLVDSIIGLTESGSISKGFVGLILLSIVGNAAGLVTGLTVSIKDKLALLLSVAVGSSIQIALFVIPFTVTLGWILGKPLTLLFDPFESIVLFLSVSTVNYVVQDGKSNWLKGMILICLYLIVAVTFWYYPVADPAGILATCI